jgi:formate C-acetyltransferase
VPYYPAETFYEAVQSIWFAFLLMPDSLGRLDQVLYPYYKRDIESGKLDYNTAYELICELLLKVFAHIGPSAHRSGDNTLVVGGYTETYEDGFNEVSKIIIEAVASLPTWRPQLSFRWTKKTPFAITQLVTELNMKCKQIVFTNDEVRLKAFDKLGFEKSDAINYTMIGCKEWAITGKSNTGSDGFFNTVKSLEEVLYHHTEEISKLNTFEEFYTYYEKILYQHIVFMCDLADAFYYANAGDLNILSSLLIEGCIEKAQSLTAGGAKYNVSCWSAIGIINLADSLSVIKKFIYEDKNFTFDGLYKMLKANWNGYENTRMEILKRGSFFGNDNDDADSMVNRIVESLNRLANLRKPKKGGEYRFGCYTGYNSAHITMGKRTRATPDGRYDGYNFTGALTAGEGKDKNGMTAFLNSAAKIDYSIFTAPLAVNLKLDKSLAKYPEKLAHIFDTYFETGGMQLQPDYLSTEELRYAQINPQEYSTLRVRVTGFSGFFTSFDKDLQNEIINRTEHGKQ